MSGTKKKVAAKLEKKVRKRRNFPNVGFQECFDFARVIYELGAGQKVRRLTAFEKIEKSPDSGPSRMLVTNTNKYGLIIGGYQADFFELTKEGTLAANNDIEDQIQLRAKFDLAFTKIDIYNQLYNRFVNNKLPSHSVIADILSEFVTDIEKDETTAIVDTFIVNLKYLGLLRTISGAERIISIEHVTDELPKSSKLPTSISQSQTANETIDLVHTSSANGVSKYESFENLCFYITPIGEENSEQRKHSDLFLEAIVEPALKQLNLEVKRADHIDKPGTITKQIIEYISKAKLVIADLSYHNPNVFYELALRHAFRLPTVQIIRKVDRIPFDLNQTRTITIDTTDIYSLVPKIETYRSEIANQVRQVLNDPDAVDNPIVTVFPKLSIKIQ
ncbi:hypothetical protein [Niabella beijingensis]|uniref:hypothetical protein n=1 Tax=Niabella beijingensis TaxID=2872700 RepID=UPI001CBB1BC3|nr:hypothetical protein [Niabella beijingensis]MBZ4187438.1 hypothetical protein [Niabella beijingensis]